MSASLRTLFALTILASSGLTPAYADAARPTPPRHGIELRLVGLSHDAARFSPANLDGRLDSDVLRASFAIGSKGAGRETLSRLLGEHTCLIVRLEVERTGAAGAILDSIQSGIEVPSSGSASPIVVAAELSWDGRDSGGAFVPDGTYQYHLETQLVSDDRDRERSLAQIEAGAGSVVIDNTPPHVELTFPVTRSLTDAADLTVAGIATDPAGVGTVLVNGIAAANEANRWRVVVPLALGQNTVVVGAEDLLGNVARTAARAVVERQEKVLTAPTAIARNAAGTQAFVVDRALNALFRVDPSTGARTLVSGTDVGSGPRFEEPFSLALDEAHNRAFVGSGIFGSSPQVLAVNLATGDRTVVSSELRALALEFDAVHDRILLADFRKQAPIVLDPSTGQWHVIGGVGYVSHIALDDTGENAYVIRRGFSNHPSVLVAVHLATEEVVLVSGDGRGEGPDFRYSTFDLALDPPRNRVVVVQERNPSPGDLPLATLQLVAVDLASGDRTPITDEDDGTGPMPLDDLAPDLTHDRLLGVSSTFGALIGVDLATGKRTIVGETAVGVGPALAKPRIFGFTSVVLDPPRSRAIVAYGENGELLAVDLRDGERRILSSPSYGSGPALHAAIAVAIDPASDRILAVDGFEKSTLFSVDPITGDREIVSGAERGTGPALERVTDLATTGDGRAIIAIASDYFDDSQAALVEVDLRTGDRRIVSSMGVVGEGEGFHHFLQEVEIDSTGRVFAAAQAIPNDILFSVDLTTGNRTVLSKSIGDGGNAAVVLAMGLDEVRHRALVSVENDPQEELVAIDLMSGDRSVLAGPEIARGPGLFAGAIAGDALNDRLFVIDHALNALLAVDAESGDRVIVSK